MIAANLKKAGPIGCVKQTRNISSVINNTNGLVLSLCALSADLFRFVIFRRNKIR